MFNKDFVKDNGKIRMCDSNIAKMNIIEYLILKRFFINTIKDTFSYVVTILKNILELLVFILFILLLIVAPISFPIIAYLHIRESKKNVIKYNK